MTPKRALTAAERGGRKDKEETKDKKAKMGKEDPTQRKLSFGPGALQLTS
jgi:hypothetical protein